MKKALKKKTLKKKAALLAAGSIAAASMAVSAAAAPSLEPAPPAIVIEAPAPADEPAAGEAEDATAAKAAKWALGGALVGALAGLARLMGLRRLTLQKAARALAGATKTAARGAAATTGVAIKAAGRVAGRTLGAPLRWAAGLGALGIFILTGVGLYDVEWVLGLAVGAGLALAGAATVRRWGRLMRRGAPVRVKDNKN